MKPAETDVGGDREAAKALLTLHSGLLPAALVGEALETLAGMIRAQLAGAAEPQSDIDGLIDQLRRFDRARLGQVYDAYRETTIFRRVITAPELLAAAEAATGAKRLHSPFQHAVLRLDLAGEHWRGFSWHQDHPYNMLAEGFVTAWTPLTPAGPYNGSIEVAPARSDRLYPVEIRFKRDAQGARLSTRDAFIAQDLQAGFDASAKTLSLAPGDVALFDSRLVHRSGFNPGPRHRISIQARFGDLLAPDILRRGWANRRVDGFETFEMLHSDLIAPDPPADEES